MPTIAHRTIDAIRAQKANQMRDTFRKEAERLKASRPFRALAKQLAIAEAERLKANTAARRAQNAIEYRFKREADRRQRIHLARIARIERKAAALIAPRLRDGVKPSVREEHNYNHPSGVRTIRTLNIATHLPPTAVWKLDAAMVALEVELTTTADTQEAIKTFLATPLL